MPRSCFVGHLLVVRRRSRLPPPTSTLLRHHTPTLVELAEPRSFPTARLLFLSSLFSNFLPRRVARPFLGPLCSSKPLHPLSSRDNSSIPFCFPSLLFGIHEMPDPPLPSLTCPSSLFPFRALPPRISTSCRSLFSGDCPFALHRTLSPPLFRWPWIAVMSTMCWRGSIFFLSSVSNRRPFLPFPVTGSKVFRVRRTVMCARPRAAPGHTPPAPTFSKREGLGCVHAASVRGPFPKRDNLVSVQQFIPAPVFSSILPAYQSRRSASTPWAVFFLFSFNFFRLQLKTEETRSEDILCFSAFTLQLFVRGSSELASFFISSFHHGIYSALIDRAIWSRGSQRLPYLWSSLHFLFPPRIASPYRRSLLAGDPLEGPHPVPEGSERRHFSDTTLYSFPLSLLWFLEI